MFKELTDRSPMSWRDKSFCSWYDGNSIAANVRQAVSAVTIQYPVSKSKSMAVEVFTQTDSGLSATSSWPSVSSSSQSSASSQGSSYVLLTETF